jgi:hypothetical protein
MRLGTDHPFFPPLDGEQAGQMWPSVCTNLRAIDESFTGPGQAAATAKAVLGSNAVRLLNLRE